MAPASNLSASHSENNSVPYPAQFPVARLLDYEPELDREIPEEPDDTDWQDFLSYHAEVLR